jgi:DNA-binding NarL/FixJ family response regulator
MKTAKTVPDWAWQFYQAKQAEALTCVGDGVEEALNYLVHLFADGEIPDNAGRLEQLVDNHLAGERQKTRRRQNLLEKFGATLSDDSPPSPVVACWSECLRAIRSVLKPAQWQLLTDLADGNSYGEISTARTISVSATKSAVCRIRKQLRTLDLLA